MLPCLEGEGCDLLINRSGWTCTQPGGRIKTTTVRTWPPGCTGGAGALGTRAHWGGGTPHTGDDRTDGQAARPSSSRTSLLCSRISLSPGCSDPSHGH